MWVCICVLQIHDNKNSMIWAQQHSLRPIVQNIIFISINLLLFSFVFILKSNNCCHFCSFLVWLFLVYLFIFLLIALFHFFFPSWSNSQIFMLSFSLPLSLFPFFPSFFPMFFMCKYLLLSFFSLIEYSNFLWLSYTILLSLHALWAYYKSV